jgi:glycosyltransferase involved in cell wall biosynthesis
MFHGSDVLTRPAIMLRRSVADASYVLRRKKLQREGALFLTASSFLRRELLRQGYPPERTVVHYLGVDRSTFFPVAAPCVQDFRILFVGRLVPNKGVQHLLHALDQVKADLPGVSLTVVGDGPERSSLVMLAQQLRLAVNFTGHLTPAAVAKQMRTSQLLVAPSLQIATGASEGLNLSVVEAQACGLPVVAYRTGGLAEAISEEQTGLLVPPGEVRLLAASIVELLMNSDRRSAMSSAAAHRAARMFDARRAAEQLMAMIVQVPLC